MTVREFEKIFRKYYLPLGMYALRIVGDADNAQDIVQDAFSKIWIALEKDVNIDNMRAYLYRCVRNECLLHMRNKIVTVGEESIPELSEEIIDTSERDALVWKAIGQLPERCREVFLMSKRDGFSNKEIAEELDISLKTVENQMTKAYSRLREVLGSGHKPFFLPFL